MIQTSGKPGNPTLGISRGDGEAQFGGRPCLPAQEEAPARDDESGLFEKPLAVKHLRLGEVSTRNAGNPRPIRSTRNTSLTVAAVEVTCAAVDNCQGERGGVRRRF